MRKWSFEFESLCERFTELNALEGVPQSPIFHGEGDVKAHTKMVCEALIASSMWQMLEEKEKEIVFLAAASHDIGKIKCTRLIDGEWASPRHAIDGAKLFRRLIYEKYTKKYEIGFEMREQVASLIRHHGLPLLFMEKPDTDHAVIAASTCLNMKLLYMLARADLLGRVCKDQEQLLQKVDYFKEYAIELGCYEKEMTFQNSYARYLYLNEQKIWYGEAIFDPRVFDVYVMVGIPLSGKDTYIERYLPKLPKISLDDIRQEQHLKPKEHTKLVVSMAKERAKTYLRKQQSFVWDATNTMRDTRKQLCQLFASYGARVRFIYLEASYEELIRRFHKRERVVPMEVTMNMLSRMDMIESWEGESVIYVVE